MTSTNSSNLIKYNERQDNNETLNNNNKEDVLLTLTNVNKQSLKYNIYKDVSKVIGFRVSLYTYLKYKELSREDKSVLRSIVERVINEYVGQRVNNNVNININVNVNQQLLHVEVTDTIIALVNKLYHFKDTLPPLQRDLITKLYNEVKKHVVIK